MVLSEILDISENGIAVRCSSPLELNRGYQLCLDLQDASDQIYTTGDSVWSGLSGRAGFCFPNLPAHSLLQMRTWFSRNAENYSGSSVLFTAQGEEEKLRPDLQASLDLIAARAQTLVRGSAAAIALASSEPMTMVCQASAGADAPPVGARLEIGSGFSGECVRTGKVLRCDDTETDNRLDRERCRVLGVRSIIAAPVRSGENVIGIIEVFSPKPGAFNENDGVIVQRLAEILASLRLSTIQT
jgi:GAF domain-containing protein